MPQRHAIQFCVTAAAGLGVPAYIAATRFQPDPSQPTRGVVVLVPGGGFTRRYFDLEIEGYQNYSAAMQLARHGWIVVAIDNLGTGESTIPADGEQVTLDRCAAALAEVILQLRSQLKSGELPATKAASALPVVGVGHSLGACIITLAQGNYACCDAVGVLGYSCRYIVGAVDPETGERLRKREFCGSGYNRTTPSSQRERFYSEQVPKAIIEAEEAARVPMPNGLAEALVPGRSAAAAARIEVPVLLAFGERDVSPNPYDETRYFHRSKDVTLLILNGAGHAHNSAPERVVFWDRISNWIVGVTDRHWD